jgi:natural product biosynthesis luciferase-like monooxygenase protein
VALDFSLFFFSSDGGTNSSHTRERQYSLEIQAAKFADQHGFTAIWTPERHFQAFGAAYPNPSVLSAALAVVTQRIGIRAGSVVVPLHHFIRIAEEWALVDQLSDGRVGISLASGWHRGDFVLAPTHYENRKQLLIEGLGMLRRFWAGEPVSIQTASERVHEVITYPRPVQRILPLWITSSGSSETWRLAASQGTNVLSGMNGLESLRANIALYRETRSQHGLNPETGTVTVMLHTYVDRDGPKARQAARGPLQGYLRTFIQQREMDKRLHLRNHSPSYSPGDLDQLVDLAVDDYFANNSLIGNPEQCLELIKKLKSAGVDEIACLINFGLETNTVLDGLEELSRLRSSIAQRDYA